MRSAGRSRLFHAIVVAGSSLVAACGSNKPAGHDVAADHLAADASADVEAGAGMDAPSITFEVRFDEARSDDVGVSCVVVMKPSGACVCEVPDGGPSYPCFI